MDQTATSWKSSAVGGIHDFFAVALAGQGWALRKATVGLFQVVDQTGTAVARFTDDRERAMTTDGLGLLRLDHPLVASQLAKWRSTPPKRLSSSERQTSGWSSVPRWWLFEGWRGARTHDSLLTYKQFPGARLRPPGHPSTNDTSVSALVPFSNAAPYATQRCHISGQDRLAPDKPRQVQAIQGLRCLCSIASSP
jgi:hypothetical protein